MNRLRKNGMCRTWPRGVVPCMVAETKRDVQALTASYLAFPKYLESTYISLSFDSQMHGKRTCWAAARR